MSDNSPGVDRVIQVLLDEGYEARPTPVKVGSLTFDFQAVLIAPRGLDLVIVVDTLQQRPERIHDALEGFGRALDRLASRRSITVVLVGPPPRQAIIEGLARTGRVLTVGTPFGAQASQSIKEALSVMLPLHLPEVTIPTVQSWEALTQRLTGAHAFEVVAPLLEAAPDGAESVREASRSMLAAPFEDDDLL